MLRVLIPLLFALALLGCGDDDDGGAAVFEYHAFDGDGAVLVEGTLTLIFVPVVSETGDEHIDVEGSWSLAGDADPQDVGPQLGKGSLEGMVFRNTIHLNLNPRMADNNVYLDGTFLGTRLGTFDGRWTYATFVGPTAQGDFTARRR